MRSLTSVTRWREGSSRSLSLDLTDSRLNLGIKGCTKETQ
jgi:hypothetical protein